MVAFLFFRNQIHFKIKSRPKPSRFGSNLFGASKGTFALWRPYPQNSPLDYFLPIGNTQLKLLAPNSNPSSNYNKKSLTQTSFELDLFSRERGTAINRRTLPVKDSPSKATAPNRTETKSRSPHKKNGHHLVSIFLGGE